MTTARRPNISAVGIFLAALFVMTALLSLATGAFRIPLGELFRVIAEGPSRDTVDTISHDVFWQVRLPRVVAPAEALDMMLTGRAVDARRARRMGLVDAAVPLRVAENAARATALDPPPRRRLPFAARVMSTGLLRPLVAHLARKQVARRARRCARLRGRRPPHAPHRSRRPAAAQP